MKTIKKYKAHLLFLVVAASAVIGMRHLSSPSRSAVQYKPKTPVEFAKTSVMVKLVDRESGGSGVILSSNKKTSIIMTNKHVCQVIQGGGIVQTLNKRYNIVEFKIYPFHDLCLVKVKGNLRVNTVIAKDKPELFSSVYVSGHPNLLPHVLTTGYFSDYKTIQLIVGMQPCTAEDFKKDPFTCLFMGGTPIIRKMASQVVTATIMAGSSGSAVFNSDGEISGLVFAGNSEGLSYGFIVPLVYVKDFIRNERLYRWVKPKKGSDKNFLVNIEKNIKIACKGNKTFYSETCYE